MRVVVSVEPGACAVCKPTPTSPLISHAHTLKFHNRNASCHFRAEACLPSLRNPFLFFFFVCELGKPTNGVFLLPRKRRTRWHRRRWVAAREFCLSAVHANLTRFYSCWNKAYTSPNLTCEGYHHYRYSRSRPLPAPDPPLEQLQPPIYNLPTSLIIKRNEHPQQLTNRASAHVPQPVLLSPLHLHQCSNLQFG